MTVPDHGLAAARPAHQIVTYFALAYGITWGAILLYLATVRFDFAALGTEQLLGILSLMLVGPPAAGLALTGLYEGRLGLAGLVRRVRHVRVAPRWYAMALLPVPALLLVVLLPLSVWVSPDYAPTFLAFGIAAGLLAGFLEEIGWTGFATPRLLERYSPLQAGLILGLLWALWHGLADFAGSIAMMSLADWVIRMVVFWVVPLTAYRVLMTWAYAHHRSLALGMLMHAGYTGWLVSFTMEVRAATGPEALLWQALFAGGLVLFAVVVMTLSKRAPVAVRE